MPRRDSSTAAAYDADAAWNCDGYVEMIEVVAAHNTDTFFEMGPTDQSVNTTMVPSQSPVGSSSSSVLSPREPLTIFHSRELVAISLRKFLKELVRLPSKPIADAEHADAPSEPLDASALHTNGIRVLRLVTAFAHHTKLALTRALLHRLFAAAHYCALRLDETTMNISVDDCAQAFGVDRRELIRLEKGLLRGIPHSVVRDSFFQLPASSVAADEEALNEMELDVSRACSSLPRVEVPGRRLIMFPKALPRQPPIKGAGWHHSVSLSGSRSFSRDAQQSSSMRHTAATSGTWQMSHAASQEPSTMALL